VALTVQFLHEDLKTAETLFSPGEHPTSFRPGTRREQQASEIADLRSTLQDVMARLEARGL